MSLPPNSLADDPFGPARPPDPIYSATPPPVPDENPSWNGWDVFALAVLIILSVVVFLFLTTFATQWLMFKRLPISEVAKFPLVTVVAQLLAYIFVLAFMNMLAKRGPGQTFWEAVRWNWPKSWFGFLLVGVVLSFSLQLLAHLLPMPKELPVDRFFRTAPEAWALSIFGITMAPLLEELFFRGFLYPVLARRINVVFAVIITSVAFALIHAPQLAQAWGPVLIVFLVGLILTITRAVTKSVAPGMLIHMAYNGTISMLLFAASDGFRHLEKMNQ